MRDIGSNLKIERRKIKRNTWQQPDLNIDGHFYTYTPLHLEFDAKDVVAKVQ